MKYYLLLLAALSLLLLVFAVSGGLVMVVAFALVIFDRCLFGRVKVIHGVEFTTLAIIFVAMTYEPIVSAIFAILVPTVIPTIVNSFIGDRLIIINKDFKLVKGGFGIIVNLLSVAIVYLIRSLDLIIIALVVLSVRHMLYFFKVKITESNPFFDYIGIFINIGFNLLLVFLLQPLWLSIL